MASVMVSHRFCPGNNLKGKDRVEAAAPLRLIMDGLEGLRVFKVLKAALELVDRRDREIRLDGRPVRIGKGAPSVGSLQKTVATRLPAPRLGIR